ncbi:SERINE INCORPORATOR [Salix koriyanagi]|uniref:SERINE INCORPORATOR n=1 Tax=Salix koriyanagi TaxID=2511006 RepID=A0A9Q0PV34_9ROSI|nr:SERINE INCORPORATOR [Salix koriyanagi]
MAPFTLTNLKEFLLQHETNFFHFLGGFHSELPPVTVATKKKANGNSDWTTILSFLFAIGAIVMATFSTGIDSQSFQFRKDKVQEEDDIPYDYGWNLNNSARKWSIDVGWASTWVKIVNEWFAATIYSWKLISQLEGDLGHVSQIGN